MPVGSAGFLCGWRGVSASGFTGREVSDDGAGCPASGPDGMAGAAVRPGERAGRAASGPGGVPPGRRRGASGVQVGIGTDMAEATVLPPYARNDKAAGSDSSPLVFVASTGEVDRHGDTVAPGGWRLDGYRGNPVVLWAHDYRQPAIGRADAVWSDGRALLARLEFAPTEFAGQVERLYRQGYQRGVSVGFRPLWFEERRDPVNGAFLGIRFLEQELLEISAVPVPANGEALLGNHKGSPYAEDALAASAPQGERGLVADEVVGLLRGLRG